MSKIICDICGTSYPDTADSCPICGFPHDTSMDFLGDSVDLGEGAEELDLGKGRYSGRKRQIFDFDEANARENDTVVLDEEEDEELEEPNRGKGSSIVAVIFLTVLIAILLLASAFLLFRYILPNMGSDSAPMVTTEAPVTEAPATTELTIPCQSLALNSGGEAVLTQEGMYHLIHVGVIPENTTDRVSFASANEAIATVTEDGRITAVSEGETEVYISCGNFQQTVKVICKFQEDTVPTEEALTEAGEAAETAATVNSEEKADSTEETAEAAEETKAPIRTDVKLKLKKTDITLGVYYEFQLMLDCDLKQDEVEWSVEHSHIASVDKEGNIKALKNGTTEVIAKYGDQEARCIVRCG